MSTPRSAPVGRPRDRSIDDAVLTATLEILNEQGYAAMTFEGVARRAGTSRPAIYRRWPGRPALALAAIASRLSVPAPPDTGCTLCDFGEAFNVFLAAYRTIRPDVLSALYVDCAGDEELRCSYLDTVVEPARRAVAETVDRAINRGDLLRDTDRELLLDLFGALIHYRAQFGREHLSDEEAYAAIETLLRGVAADFTGLVAHSEALDAARFAHLTGRSS
ncbi:TetR/AcrR family transcriptional regulator [Bogoriella caseilytica]|uniref:TetR family transcriptional regulator n=1 Tax=Bogoriella caseilytica TaxID=56055 RepID=A0A3N2BDJ8_9MICO|nr:TetR/AcrR family transcriptional regulator [Bogoriella caseilytica]ROR73326.1 TetR family transcriptional regulator [Bogoriella caseilytica]